ncbi:hypothetical protein SAMN05421837_104725 [Amycolatopsis pretoriensis]|uniref:Uncharacterized protein n=1 Tax=Amycolatopsis pretoriensis TaxID=218821 RepID=A0A1H5QTZ0_9PSEU|nr:hypothetical protein [Amycolatopsis pretoriensis]SEF29499.1 hypothetical protein SAMN05421837_104725 [Amycolatopsis pretoriensis]
MTIHEPSTDWTRFATAEHAEAESAPLDDNTRYLAAAAHLDRRYADDVVRESLVEDTRQVPLTPGLDTATVLTEVVAARTRRKFRDGALALLTFAFVTTGLGSPFLAAWLSWAALLSVKPIWKSVRWGRPGSGLFVVGKLAAVFFLFTGAILLPLLGELISWLQQQSSSSRSTRVSSGGNPFDTSDLLPSWFGLDAAVISGSSAVLMLVILIADRVVVWRTVRRYFGRRARVPGGERPSPDRLALLFSPPRLRRGLERHRAGRVGESPDARVPLIVYRGRNPFVGAGTSVTPWSLALPLEQLGSAAEEPLTTARFYEEVGKAVEELQRHAALSPDERLRDLRVEGMVFSPAEGLIDRVHDPVTKPYLRGVSEPPAHFLPTEEAQRIYHRPREWARYYLCFQVETWNRELVLSAFLHAAVEESTLYIEWTPCVLPPIRQEFRAGDTMTADWWRPVWQGFLRWLKLPVTGPGRFWAALKVIRPLPHDGHTLNADRYGSARTLRELGAADAARDYFQVVDAERYTKLLESRLVPAISKVLSDSGYSPASFERRVAAVTTNNVTIHGSNTGPMVFGGVVEGDVTGGTLASRT